MPRVCRRSATTTLNVPKTQFRVILPGTGLWGIELFGPGAEHRSVNQELHTKGWAAAAGAPEKVVGDMMLRGSPKPGEGTPGMDADKRTIPAGRRPGFGAIPVPGPGRLLNPSVGCWFVGSGARARGAPTNQRPTDGFFQFDEGYGSC